MPDTTLDAVAAGLIRLRAGDQQAAGELLGVAYARLRTLAATMLCGEHRLREWAGDTDVLHDALLRLRKRLAADPPDTPRAFFAAAAQEVRRELIDLARRLFGPHGVAARFRRPPPDPAGGPPPDPAGRSDEWPDRLAEWAEFHERAAALPDDEREVADLLFYQGLTQPEAAAALGVSVRTVQYRWQAAARRLAAGGRLPGL